MLDDVAWSDAVRNVSTDEIKSIRHQMSGRREVHGGMALHEPLDTADQFASGGTFTSQQKTIHLCGGTVSCLVEVWLYARKRW